MLLIDKSQTQQAQLASSLLLPATTHNALLSNPHSVGIRLLYHSRIGRQRICSRISTALPSRRDQCFGTAKERPSVSESQPQLHVQNQDSHTNRSYWNPASKVDPTTTRPNAKNTHRSDSTSTPISAHSSTGTPSSSSSTYTPPTLHPISPIHKSATLKP